MEKKVADTKCSRLKMCPSRFLNKLFVEAMRREELIIRHAKKVDKLLDKIKAKKVDELLDKIKAQRKKTTVLSHRKSMDKTINVLL